MFQRADFPFLGFGAGLRRPHYAHILKRHPDIDWFEVISENFMVAGGRPLEVLDAVRANYPVVMHGVSMSIGSTDALDLAYLRGLRALARRTAPRGYPTIYAGAAWVGIVCMTCCRFRITRKPCATSPRESAASRTCWDATY